MTKSTPRSPGGIDRNRDTRPAPAVPLARYFEHFVWYINMPLAAICFYVTTIDNNGALPALTGAPMAETLRMFKMPNITLSVFYFILSFWVFPVIATRLNY